MTSSCCEDHIQLNYGVKVYSKMEEAKSVLEKSKDVADLSQGNVFRSVFHQLVLKEDSLSHCQGSS